MPELILHVADQAVYAETTERKARLNIGELLAIPEISGRINEPAEAHALASVRVRALHINHVAKHLYTLARARAHLTRRNGLGPHPWGSGIRYNVHPGERIA